MMQALESLLPTWGELVAFARGCAAVLLVGSGFLVLIAIAITPPNGD